MKAQIKFLRLDAETDEDELVFEIIPRVGAGVYTKNRWLIRVAKCFVDSKLNLNEQISFAKTLIEDITGLKEADEQ